MEEERLEWEELMDVKNKVSWTGDSQGAKRVESEGKDEEVVKDSESTGGQRRVVRPNLLVARRPIRNAEYCHLIFDQTSYLLSELHICLRI